LSKFERKTLSLNLHTLGIRL